MSVHHQMINRPNIHHAYYPQASSGPLWPPSTLVCPISSHSIKSYSSLAYSRSEQLRIRIHENHLSYLSRDETPSKLELRAKIEALITEYLSQIPHGHKFSFKEIGDCLSQSVKKPDFDPQKAIAAFEAIERYATNLLNFPWRQEFQSIFAFSGHFYRLIECSLVGHQTIFDLLGFAFDSSTSIYKLIEVPIDPDKVSKISLELLVTIVELKIMLNIFNLVKAEFPDISWNDIHSIRTDYVCNTESAVKLISDLKKTGKLIDFDQPDYSVKKFNKLNLLSPAGANCNKTIFDDSILSPPVNYLESNLDSFEFIDGGSCIERPNDMSPVLSASTSYPVNRHDTSAVNSLGNSLRNGTLPPLRLPLEPIRDTSTGKLAPGYSDLPLHGPSIDSQLNNNNNSETFLRSNNYGDKVAKGDCKYNYIDPVLLAEINQFESNRKNVLPSNGKPKNAFPSERKLKISISDKANDRPDRGYAQVDNCYSKNAKPEVVVLDQEGTTSAAVVSHSRAPLKVKVTNLPSASAAIVRLSPKDVQDGTNVSPWSCKSCTYTNPYQRDVCEMCHRSRKQGNESTPLISGGRECSRCTLVNGKDEKFCKACGTSLADSPTYI